MDQIVSLKTEEKSFFALSPNSSKKDLERPDAFIDLYFYNVKNSFSLKCFNNCEYLNIKEPRNYDLYLEGIDNVTPIC